MSVQTIKIQGLTIPLKQKHIETQQFLMSEQEHGKW